MRNARLDLVIELSVLDVIRERGSIREYQDRAIPKDELLKIIEAATLAQSAANHQPWQFIVVTEPATKVKLVEAAHNQSFISEAATVVVCLANPGESGKVGSFDSFLVDLAIAAENIALVAWELGIGSCWIGAFNEEKVKQLFGVPRNIRVVSLLALGYPAEKPKAKHRKAVQKIFHYERYEQKEG